MGLFAHRSRATIGGLIISAPPDDVVGRDNFGNTAETSVPEQSYLLLHLHAALTIGADNGAATFARLRYQGRLAECCNLAVLERTTCLINHPFPPI